MLKSSGITDHIWSVTQVTNYLKELLETDPNLSPVMLKGEISNFHHHSSGHMYFTIKDEKTQLSAVMFRGYNQGLDFIPEDGMSVIVEGKISIYPARGQYQVYVHKMQPDGIGSLHLAYEQLKERLEKEGLFREELKQAIPKIPAKVGVVTSPTGAAIRDIISVVKRRFSNVSLLIAPSQVQGEGAEETLVRGLELLNQSDVDVIIIGRGGGSIEDLWAFNKEKLARAIFNSRVPVISAVGHETDFTIADFVADMRAPTPSAAAELVVSNREEVVKYLGRLYNNLNNAMENRVNRLNDRLLSLQERRALRLPEEKIAEYMQRIDELSMNLEQRIVDNLTKKQEKLERAVGQLNSLSPLNTFARGYSLARKLDSEEEINSITQLEEGEKIEVILKDGALECEVEVIKSEG
ncbi:exodeoxyribonuclease VII large subunit [Orenia metallireducens]|uniref:Exodeoxyribonuclease 7 large subunit n=1 Tax=Orenia metallireducens TaxID=1413210 RepID=A0A1C0A9P0_9FIRM|nr:exodeoxyribonuclease VII large subunit [Orenia metallireducens]OCL26973.1 exodeoxyribonuclease VII large subunit [Orenia metallireducens]